MVAIIDYGAGNLQSVKKALDFISAENVITGDKNKSDKTYRLKFQLRF